MVTSAARHAAVRRQAASYIRRPPHKLFSEIAPKFSAARASRIILRRQPRRRQRQGGHPGARWLEYKAKEKKEKPKKEEPVEAKS
jgi:hypothetical protein